MTCKLGMESTDNFISSLGEVEGTIDVVGRHDIETDSCVPLSENEQLRAMNTGLTVVSPRNIGPFKPMARQPPLRAQNREIKPCMSHGTI